MTVLHFRQALLPGGWAEDVRLTIDGGRIASVEAGVPAGDAERHAIAIPGIASHHSHAFQRGMAGLSEHRRGGVDSFWTWREVMYRFALTLDPDEVRIIAEQLTVEMLEAGFTTVGEFHYLHHDRDGREYADIAEMAKAVLAAAETSGISITVLPVLYRFSTFGDVPGLPEQRRFLSTPDRYARLVEATKAAVAGVDGAGFGLAPHSLRACGIEDVRRVAELGRGGPVHLHVAEQVKEVDDCLAATGARPVTHLLDNAEVDGRWCLIHATHMTAEEHARVAASGAVAGLCPVTEASLGDGIFDLPELRRRGGRFGVGTDSNIAIDPAGELRQLEYSQRLRDRARNVACDPGESTGRTLFDGARAGAAQALGRDGRGLAAGAPADIVGLDDGHPHLAAKRGDDVLDGWIFSAGGAAVDCVWARGVKKVESGRHVAREAVAARFRSLMERMVRSL